MLVNKLNTEVELSTELRKASITQQAAGKRFFSNLIDRARQAGIHPVSCTARLPDRSDGQDAGQASQQDAEGQLPQNPPSLTNRGVLDSKG